jgi:hypothetical protein
MRLVLDEDVNWKIALELTARGYDASSSEQMRLARRRVKDPVWLYILTRQTVAWVLVTFDDAMPMRHRTELLRRGSTLAVIDSKADRKGRTREEYTREVIHRWAHRMVTQAGSSRFRYRLSGRSAITL